MTLTREDVIVKVLNRLRGALGTKENPAGSNNNFIVDWYNENVNQIGRGPWCEMTNTWAMWTGGAKKLKVGRAYTPYAAGDAQKKANGASWHWGTKGMRAGDQVYYDWGTKKVRDSAFVDHTGTVEKVCSDGTFYVLEGNYKDELKRVHRDSKYVMGYVSFDWNQLLASPSPDPTSTKPVHLKITGELDVETIKAWQRIMKTPVDGKIDPKNSDLVVAVQRRLRATVDNRLVVDGEGIYQNGLSYKTVGALQRYLKSPVDCKIDKKNSNVIKALQRRLNEGRF